MKVQIDIITCPEWQARHPNGPIQTCRRSIRVIIHHTAGHHHEISNPRDESLEEAMRYAQDIQHAHMETNGWNDSGHNFLVTRAGHILQGRWLTVSAIQAGHMVVSAHCPTQNMQIGIEHEHNNQEKMTDAQFESSARLQAWIAAEYHRSTPLMAQPHGRYFSTACPANLITSIPALEKRALAILHGK